MWHPLLGELLGTAFLIIFGGGVVANTLLHHSKGQSGGWLAITTGWFIAVVIGIFVAKSTGSIQADINPAVTIAKTLLGHYNLEQMSLTIIAQCIGAFIGAAIVWLAYYPHWEQTPDKTAKLAVFSTSPAIRHKTGNLVSEIIGTFVLVMGVGAIFGHATSGHPVTGFGPYLVGLLVWGIGLSLGGATGYAINPARDLGPRIAHSLLPIAGKGSSDWSYAWVPVLGPVIGACIAALLWRLIF